MYLQVITNDSICMFANYCVYNLTFSKVIKEIVMTSASDLLIGCETNRTFPQSFKRFPQDTFQIHPMNT